MGEQVVRLRVVGMTCEGCRRAIISAIMAQPGAQSVEVSLESGQVVVKGDGSLNRATVAGAIADAGFDIAPDNGA
jgi:copper chaperone CopZ